MGWDKLKASRWHTIFRYLLYNTSANSPLHYLTLEQWPKSVA
jgi:hypothetical protein